MQHAQQKLECRQCFLKLLSNVRFLARQGLPLHGDGDECDSNYLQLLKLRGEDNSRVFDWLKKQKTDKYTSPEMQNEMIRVMALQVLRVIASSLHSTAFYTVMADETTDTSNHEQVVICLHWVSNDFEVHKEFMGLYFVELIKADTLTAVIKDVLQRLNLSLSKLRGQCYDGAATMAGYKSGVAQQLLQEETKVLYTHCYGHALNLACADTIKQVKLLKDALDTAYELVKLIKYSPQREACFARLKADLAPITPGVRALCPTRWTVRAEALQSILDNYEVLSELWIESLDVIKDSDMKARINGVASQMKGFDFFYGVSLGQLILRHSDNLSRTLQRADISAAEGQEVTRLIVTTLRSLRSESMYKLFWEKVTKIAASLGVTEPKLPRRRKVPRRMVLGSVDTHSFPSTIEDYYRQMYFEALDLITTCICNTFYQPGYKMYCNIQELLLKIAISPSSSSSSFFSRPSAVVSYLLTLVYM